MRSCTQTSESHTRALLSLFSSFFLFERATYIRSLAPPSAPPFSLSLSLSLSLCGRGFCLLLQPSATLSGNFVLHELLADVLLIMTLKNSVSDSSPNFPRFLFLFLLYVYCSKVSSRHTLKQRCNYYSYGRR